ncbi:MAG: MFS transporter [Bacteroidota bacterium]|nr:MFS transporter [Bacteroidota bacterium]
MMTASQQRRRRTLFGWYMYDWANSAFATTVLAALFGPYLDTVVVPKGGVVVPFLGKTPLGATSLYGYALGISALIVLLIAPLLGAVADAGGCRKRFLALFALSGSIATACMLFIGAGDVTSAIGLFTIANVCFVSANVFYDSFLPHIALPEERDRVSGTGYAFGYAGGGLLFLSHLLFVRYHDFFGVSDSAFAIRIALSSVGFWWGGFSLITLALIHEPVSSSLSFSSAVAAGLRRLATTMRKLRRLPQLLLFLCAFLVFNDGIQTVIAMATVYGSEELGFDTMTLMGCLLMVQVVGIAGSRFFATLGDRIGSKSALLASLAVWVLVASFAYFMTRALEFWLLGGAVGFVLGGSQALSRSLFSRMIPAEASAEFFGFFSIFEKFSAIGGPIVFAVVRQFTGSSRNSILALVAFFILGAMLLFFVDVERAESEGSAFREEGKAVL